MSDELKTDSLTEEVNGRQPLSSRLIKTYTLTIRRPERPEELVKVASPLVRVGSREGNDVVVRDPSVSRLHFELCADERGHRLRDLGSTNGTVVDGYRTADIYLRDGSVIEAGRVRLSFKLSGHETGVQASSTEHFGPVLGRSLSMRELFSTLERASRTDVTILIEGETGTGKELIAHAIYETSRRSTGPFVVFDCSAVAPTLLESELFGHEKGAFTGAVARRVGLLEEADGGTLFLDEIGELSAELQPRLLRALEEGQLRRVGGAQTIKVDVRIIAATNRDLAEEVNRGSFREDLYYRLAVIRLVCPPLRERTEDISLLVEHFVRSACRGDRLRIEQLLSSISPANWKKLTSHPWPGNVRELRNMIERTVALSEDSRPLPIEPETSRPAPRSGERSVGAPIDLERPFMEQKAELIAGFEEAYLRGQLQRAEGNVSHAASASGLERMYFKRLLKKYQR